MAAAVDEDLAEIEDDLELLQERAKSGAFGDAWEDFRQSIVQSGRRESLEELKLESRRASSSSAAAAAGPALPRSQRGGTEGESEGAHSSLTPGERRDIDSWRTRLGRTAVFGRYYCPERWEAREMKSLVEFLALEDPREGPPSYLDQPEYEATKRAVTSLFFPGYHDPSSVLLKRGPILFDGAEERELLLFTHGFVFSRIEFDALLNILFTINSENPQLLGPDQLKERFNALDTDRSGCLDRCELKEVFTGMGLPISEQALSNIMERFDTDQDGTIDADEFMEAMQSHTKPKRSPRSSVLGSLNVWGGKALRRMTGSFGSEAPEARKMDCACLFSDVERVEVVDVCSSGSTRMFANSSWAELTFAVFVRGREDPLIVVCSKPEQRAAWVDAFRTCYVASTQMRADNDSESAKEVARRLGWQHRIVRASLFSLVLCNDVAGLKEKVANPSPGVDVNARDEYHGFTALHYAVVLGNVHIVELLLRHGAKTNLCDNNQKTPLDHAKELSENKDMVHLLKKAYNIVPAEVEIGA